MRSNKLVVKTPETEYTISCKRGNEKKACKSYHINLHAFFSLIWERHVPSASVCDITVCILQSNLRRSAVRIRPPLTQEFYLQSILRNLFGSHMILFPVAGWEFIRSPADPGIPFRPIFLRCCSMNACWHMPHFFIQPNLNRNRALSKQQ